MGGQGETAGLRRSGGRTTAARQSLERTHRKLKERGVRTPTTMLHWLADERAAGGDLRGAFALLVEAMAGHGDATRLSAGGLRDALRLHHHDGSSQMRSESRAYCNSKIPAE